MRRDLHVIFAYVWIHFRPDFQKHVVKFFYSETLEKVMKLFDQDATKVAKCYDMFLKHIEILKKYAEKVSLATLS